MGVMIQSRQNISVVSNQMIRSSFSQVATEYDSYAGLHRSIARDLEQRIGRMDFSGPLLDVGMGTGWLTHRLQRAFPKTDIIGIDSAMGMVEKAVGVSGFSARVLLADAHALPFRNESIGLVTSNLACQWISDLSGAFADFHRVLTPKGQMIITMFGRETLGELFEVMEQSCAQSRRGLISFRRLASAEQIHEATVLAGFNNIVVEREFKKVSYADMKAILQWTRNIGANVLNPRFFMGKDFLRKAQERYGLLYRDGAGVYATFEVVRIQADKNQTNI